MPITHYILKKKELCNLLDNAVAFARHHKGPQWVVPIAHFNSYLRHSQDSSYRKNQSSFKLIYWRKIWWPSSPTTTPSKWHMIIDELTTTTTTALLILYLLPLSQVTSPQTLLTKVHWQNDKFRKMSVFAPTRLTLAPFYSLTQLTEIIIISTLSELEDDGNVWRWSKTRIFITIIVNFVMSCEWSVVWIIYTSL